MELRNAVAAVETVKNGNNVHFDWNDWNAAECVLRDNGYNDMADTAHSEMVWAYRKEEQRAGLN